MGFGECLGPEERLSPTNGAMDTTMDTAPSEAKGQSDWAYGTLFLLLGGACGWRQICRVSLPLRKGLSRQRSGASFLQRLSNLSSASLKGNISTTRGPWELLFQNQNTTRMIWPFRNTKISWKIFCKLMRTAKSTQPLESLDLPKQERPSQKKCGGMRIYWVSTMCWVVSTYHLI